MNRRKLLTGLLCATGAAAAARLLPGRLHAAEETGGKADDEFPPVNITREQWQEILPADRYRILFREGTEAAGSSPLDKVYDPGTYICAACFLPLFASEDKFDSGTGWPSFTQPIEGRVGTKTDWKLLLPRTEYHCIRCGGHQGHVFDDGPPPTGQRWCNNGLALRFVPEREALPELRTSA